MKNEAIKIDDKTVEDIKRYGDPIVRKIAREEGISTMKNWELLDCGSFYRVLIEYE